jgi:organic hydroperoxide reductase OsmC/OhrA
LRLPGLCRANFSTLLKGRPMPAPFPHHYDVRLDASAGDRSALIMSGGRPWILAGAPPEFDGNALWWSPEHLLISATALCMMTTVQALAARARVPIESYASHAEGTLDKTGAGLGFTEIVVTVEVTVAEEHRARMEALVEGAKKYCIVSNALKVPVTVEAVVRAAAAVGVPIAG